jgi:hypothetical protein
MVFSLVIFFNEFEYFVGEFNSFFFGFADEVAVKY